jgi:hypothetical protein
MVLFCAALLAACTSTATPPYPPAPAPLADPMPKPPVTPEVLVWQPGHWDWTGSAYTWSPGLYVPAAGHGGNWMTGWWNRVNGAWQWEPAHWTGS